MIFYSEALAFNGKALFQAAQNIYHQELAFDLWASSAANFTAKSNRSLLLSLAANKNIQVPEQESNTAMNELIQSFSSLDDFKKQLDKSNTNIDLVKTKLQQNLVLDKVFNTYISPIIKQDLEYKNQLIQKNLSTISNHNFLEEKLNFIEKSGGELQYRNLLSKYQLQENDIDFLIQAKFAQEENLKNILAGQAPDPNNLKPAYQTALNNLIENYSNNLSRNFKFRLAYLSKDNKDATQIINQAYDDFSNYADIFRSTKVDNSIEILDFEITENSNLINPQLYNELLKLSPDGLQVQNNISPIIDTPKAFYVLKLLAIELPSLENNIELENLIKKRIINHYGYFI